MKDLYVVIDDKMNPTITYYNENPLGCQEEIMSFEDAKYTAEFLGAKVYKLVSVELDEEFGSLSDLKGWGNK